ncbi:HtaA domain-containing protein [Conexibacter sp. CPCC 206217]|uniref:HtaA domain-containing protein n=1 Tax=Conexibacter sp. CPCC 206217 TaxID=3064574 RepID=UPI0027277A86|nr:HtaA domain-containing protein [Conexibacter sp. CPCC 206217]MDO8209976.1 HtaA domain-containing protein [Conexibacter sp. CPCC 206217]
MPRAHPRRRRLGRFALATGVAASTAVIVAAAAPAAALAAGEPPVSLASGHLDWGVKQSFRTYIAGPIAHGSITVSDGVTTNPDGSFRFPLQSGSFDPVARTTVVQFDGRVHFSGHAGQLEMELTDPRVELTADGAQLVADVESKQLDGATIGYPGVALADLDIGEASPTIGGSVLSPTTTWTALPATLTAPGAPAFAGFYTAGTTLDPVTFAYDGPGGKPALEQWTAPGVSKYELSGTYSRPGWKVYTVLPDERRDVTHAILNVGGGKAAVQALDPATLAPKADPVEIDWKYSGATLDPSTGTVFVHTVPSGAGSRITLLRWHEATASYTTESVPTTNAAARQLAYDPFTRTLYGVQEDDFIPQPVIRQGDDGSWTFTSYAPENMYPLSMTWRDVVTATDGTILEVDNSYYNVTTPIVTRHYDPVTRTVSRRAIPGQEALGISGLGFTWIQPGPDATAYAAEFRKQQGYLVKLRGSDGEWALDGPPLRPGIAAAGIAVDPNDATVGLLDGAYDLQILDRAGRTVRTIPNPNRSGTLDTHVLTGADGTIYMRADWYESEGGSAAYAITRSGASPALTQQPQDASVEVEDAPGASAQATFAAAADGTPAPSVRWQVRVPGSAGWSDVPGATSGSLTVAATAAEAGSRYRAVFENAAGAVATAPATLSVKLLPTTAPPTGGEDPPSGGDQPGGDLPGGGQQPPPPQPPAPQPQPQRRPAAPRVSQLKLSATRLTLRLSGAARGSARIERRTVRRVRRNGRTRTKTVWRHVRTVRLSSARAGTIGVRLPRLSPGTYRVTVRADAPGSSSSSIRLARTVVVRAAPATRR